jgi:hypothetical protein
MIDPIEYPKIRVGGRDIEVRFRQFDIIQLKKLHGIDLLQPTEAKLLLMSIENLERNLILLKHGIAHDSPEVTVDDLSKEFDFDRMAEVDSVLSDAIKKARSRLVSYAEKLIAERTSAAAAPHQG